MVKLERFLRTGELGSLRAGMSRAEVVRLLGAPEDESVSSNPLTLKYGGLQLTFWIPKGAAERQLTHLGLYFSPRAEAIPESVRPADFSATEAATLAQVLEFLAQVGLEASASGDGETNYLEFPSGARIAFEGQHLDSVQFSPRTAVPTRKQLSLSIPQITWDRLKALARQSNRPVSELCAEWITQRANELQHDNAGEVSERV